MCRWGGGLRRVCAGVQAGPKEPAQSWPLSRPRPHTVLYRPSNRPRPPPHRSKDEFMELLMGTSLPDTLNQYDARIKLGMGLHLDEVVIDEVGGWTGGCVCV